MRRWPAARRRATVASSITRPSIARRVSPGFRYRPDRVSCGRLPTPATRAGTSRETDSGRGLRSGCSSSPRSAVQPLARLGASGRCPPTAKPRFPCCPVPASAAPNFAFFARSSFCREFPVVDAPESPANRAGGFGTIDEMLHFVEEEHI